jgi:hypothetical protein
MRRFRFEHDDALDGDVAVNSLVAAQYRSEPRSRAALAAQQQHERIPPMPFALFLLFLVCAVAIIFVSFQEQNPDLEVVPGFSGFLKRSHVAGIGAFSQSAAVSVVDPEVPVLVIGSGLAGIVFSDSRQQLQSSYSVYHQFLSVPFRTS